MKYLSAEDILIIHARIVDATGGAHGVRDVHLVASAAERPRTTFGKKDLYPDVCTKAAAYLESIARHHAFLDGNKRTAIAAAARFLFLNGYELRATNKELEKFVLAVAVGKKDVPEIASWFKKYTRKMGAR